MTDTKTLALVAEVERLTRELAVARQAEEIAIANAAGLRRWQERILAAAEAVYGDKSRRFKLCLRKNGTASNVFPDWLDGRWVAFQTAEDDGHIGLVAQLDKAKATSLSLADAVMELAAAKQDAERYRWLCKHMIIPKPSLWDTGLGFTCELPNLPAHGRMDKGGLDVAIDAAMRRTDAGAVDNVVDNKEDSDIKGL